MALYKFCITNIIIIISTSIKYCLHWPVTTDKYMQLTLNTVYFNIKAENKQASFVTFKFLIRQSVPAFLNI